MTKDNAAIRTLHINTERTWRGGEQQTFSLVEGLASRGHQVTLVCQAGSPLHDHARVLPIEALAMRVHGEIDLVAMFRLASTLRKRAIDIVHMHTSHAHTLGCAGAALARRGKCVVSRRVDFSIRRSFASRWKYRWNVDRYIAISHAIKGVMVNDGIDDSRISVVHSGIDLSRFEGIEPADIRGELGLDRDTPLIGNVAHMADHKGQSYLIDAMPSILSELPAAHLVIAGAGEMYDELVAQVARLGIERSVSFLRFRTDVPALLKALNVFVMSSHMEGLGTSILDAMACGTPVVGTNVGGIPEIISDGENGLLVPARNPEKLAGAIVRVLNDSNLAARFAETGRMTVERGFTVDTMVEGNLAAYRELLAVESASSH